ncbi:MULTISPECIES: DUF4240 domain-containing protein [Kitasatospora]|uniref:DUF4240 domain-containing protein n=1 Tax=Kitasatospora setae (strain ATCC 33774 / DSM 43861 / JCM 3304 / KCC A-0304 / NBRC 14216 / KM-6054) TaxID=452652 RepID=E4N214_KITSK|nr:MULTISPECIES: DUF4240 domain-containing protein [Kitasatospora]BAJ32198.1 hypothetical protein KSE_64390 [Kitasatospora setae KM-6054]
MDTDGFWTLVESSAAGDLPCTRADRLTDRLAGLPLPEVLDFQLRLDEARAPLDTPATLAVAKLVLRGRVSDDSLWYFHAWLIGLGQDAHHLAVHDPDALAGHPALRRLAALPYRRWENHDFPDWESVDYCAQEAYERLTGEEDGLEEAMEAIGHDSPCNAGFADPAWTSEESAARLPRLTALFADAG